jgi:type IV pilus assembly protein PilE
MPFPCPLRRRAEGRAPSAALRIDSSDAASRKLRPDPQAWRQAPAAPGFTAAELMLAVLLIGVLLSIAWPAYREQVARARRAEMQSVLAEDADYMQRYYAVHNAYAADPPPRLTYPTAPRAGTPAYRISVAVPPGDLARFVLTATRDGPMRDDRCGDFTYDDLGRRGLVDGSASPGATADGCWR